MGKQVCKTTIKFNLVFYHLPYAVNIEMVK